MLAIEYTEREPLLFDESVNLRIVVFRLVSKSKNHAVILDQGYRPIGILSSRDALRAIIVEVEEGVELLEYPDLREALETPVKHYMTRDPITGDESLEAWEAARLMADRGIGCLPLVDPDSVFKALVTEDRLARLASKLAEVTVEEIMSSPLIAVEPDDLLAEVAGLMHQQGVRRVVVLSGKGYVVTALDLLGEVVKPENLERLHRGERDPLDAPAYMLARQAPTLKPQDPVGSIAETVATHPTGCGLVVDEEGEPIGIVTVKDLMVAVASGDPELWKS